MNAIRREWREGKVRPIPGNSPHDRLVSRGIIPSLRRICDDPFPTTHSFSATATNHTRRPVCVFKAWRNLSGPMWFQNQNQTPGRGRAASRWSAPSPGKRTRREDHAPSHRPQMSSGRLFLDRVARQQGPSPLHRHPQINTHSQGVQAKGDISTLPGRRHFYFALTPHNQDLLPLQPRGYDLQHDLSQGRREPKSGPNACVQSLCHSPERASNRSAQ